MSAAIGTPFGLFIGGREIPSSDGQQITLLNPATNRPLAEAAVGRVADAHHALEVADRAFRESGWAGGDGAQRTKALYRLSRLLEEQAAAFAELESLNMGKPLRESKGDIDFVVRTLEYMAGLADKIEGETIPIPGARFDYTIREPLGVTVHIAPWNYPLLLAVRSVAPALAAGNAVVLKPASLTPLTALRFAQLAHDAGIPDGILNVVVGSGREVGEALITDARCASVSFTGSGEVGRRIAELAAARLIPTVLELGGKSPVIVFPDADLERAARAIATGIFQNSGQMCWAGSRLVVEAGVEAALLEKLRAAAQGLKLGPGIEAGVTMGPLVSKDQMTRVLGFVDEAREAGARIFLGGGRPAAPELQEGNFVEPTVVTDVDPDARLVREEVFGPVLAVHRFESADEALRLANRTRFGLFASLWTRDLATAHGVARQLEAGMVTINEPPMTFPQTPFGGYKESGLGSEQGRDAPLAYTRRKNVIVNVGAAKPKK
ncbi:MAG: aldehyde dehydrogenase family protein [Thermoplasmata archaeon]|nr:aldehyde dehydrogenase family protein [Thermoplasmata archaeon]